MSMSMLIRPVQQKDVDELFKLAQLASPGMTNFPPIRSILEQKIDESLRSFTKSLHDLRDEFYFLVMEDLEFHKIVGCCALYSRLGQKHPFYNYKVSREDLVSESLRLHKRMDVLYLVNDYDDCSEICMLFLSPHVRRHHYGQFLSRSRFMFIANFPERFAQKVIASMRGTIDEKGQSLFWDALGKKFCDIDFVEADHFVASGQKQFIIDVMPRLPIYVSLLPTKVQAIIGKVHSETKPALGFLKREGFTYENYLDILDAGPVVESKVSNIRTVYKSRHGFVTDIVDEICSDVIYILSNTCLNFRACLANIIFESDEAIVLSTKVAEALDVSIGGKVRWIRLSE